MRLLALPTLSVMMLLSGCSMTGQKGTSPAEFPEAPQIAAPAPAEGDTAQHAPEQPRSDPESYPEGWHQMPWGEVQLRACDPDRLKWVQEEAPVIPHDASDTLKPFYAMVENMRHLAAMPETAHHRQQALQDIRGQLQTLKQYQTGLTDTMLLHARIFAGHLQLEPILAYLHDSLGVGPDALYGSGPILISEADWEQVRFKMMISRAGKVMNERPLFFRLEEESPQEQSPLNKAYTYHLRDFIGWDLPSMRFMSGDTLIGTISDRAFEVNHHVFTIWKRRQDDRYELVTILDTWLHEAIGVVEVEQLHHLEQGHKILVGTSWGGDGGSAWGTVWVALWSAPRQLRLLEFWPWESEADEFSEKLTYTYSPGSHTLRLVKTHYSIDPSSWEKNDSTFTRFEVRIPDILHQDRTLEFNLNCRLED